VQRLIRRSFLGGRSNSLLSIYGPMRFGRKSWNQPKPHRIKGSGPSDDIRPDRGRPQDVALVASAANGMPHRA
jgi:hypothetical protein